MVPVLAVALSLLIVEIVALQQLKLSAAKIAVDQVLPNENSFSNRYDLLSVAQEHFRGGTAGRFAEVLGGGDRVHFRYSEFHPVPL